ncbi:MAG: transposase [Acidobacteriaceae bacterium]|nr:transposase [Acidobacteriaceae bacterium]
MALGETSDDLRRASLSPLLSNSGKLQLSTLSITERAKKSGSGRLSFWFPLFTFVYDGWARPVLRYLGRYTHRVAISNHPLVSFDGEQITLR